MSERESAGEIGSESQGTEEEFEQVPPVMHQHTSRQDTARFKDSYSDALYDATCLTSSDL